jgi:uncharacterized membrane protein YbhN (UPF0104 family)
MNRQHLRGATHLESGAGGRREESPDTGTRRRWWPRLRLALTLLFFAAVTVLLVRAARDIDWQEVVSALRGYRLPTLAAAAVMALIGHLVYTAYDLLGRRYTGHDLSTPRVISIAFVSYAFNLNMGPLIGAMAFRFRLYSKQGLSKSTITRVLGFSVTSNWLGYALLAGILFGARALEPPPDWAIGAGALQGLGAVLVLLVCGYLGACAFSRVRRVTVRGHTVELPPWRLALLQLAASCACWMTIGVILYVLLGQQISYFTVLAVLLLAAVAAMLTHIPAGLGVLEVTFVLLLGHLLPRYELLAGVLAYRVLYYLIPLGVAALVFVWLEARTRQH